MTGTNAPAGYTYKWYVLKDEAAKETFRQNSASVNLFETAGHLFNTYLTPTITVTGPGSYYLQCISPNNWKSSVREFKVANAIPENLNASNNSPAELGGVGALTIGQVVPATAYSWTGPPGSNFSQAIRNPLITGLTEAHIGTYTVTISVGEACSYTSTTAVTLANCDIYIQGYDGTGAETFELVRNGGQTTTATYQPLTLKVLPFEGTNTFGNYNITWMLNGSPISGAPNKPEYIATGLGTYTAQLSLKLNPATNCVAEAQVNAKPCNNYGEVACGAPVDVHLPDIQAAGVSLAPGDKFTAGDYTVVITEISSGDPSGYIGTGYVEMRLVAEIVAKKIAVDFTNLVVNTCYEMASGDVVTQYDPNWGGILDGDQIIGSIDNLVKTIADEFKGLIQNFTGSCDEIRKFREKIIEIESIVGKDNTISTEVSTSLNSSSNEIKNILVQLESCTQCTSSSSGRIASVSTDCSLHINRCIAEADVLISKLPVGLIEGDLVFVDGSTQGVWSSPIEETVQALGKKLLCVYTKDSRFVENLIVITIQDGTKLYQWNSEKHWYYTKANEAYEQSWAVEYYENVKKFNRIAYGLYTGETIDKLKNTYENSSSSTIPGFIADLVADGVVQTFADIYNGSRERKKAVTGLFLPTPGGSFPAGLALSKLSNIAGKYSLKFIRASGGSAVILTTALNVEILRYSLTSLRYELKTTLKKAFNESAYEAVYRIWNTPTTLNGQNFTHLITIFKDKDGNIFYDAVETGVNKILNNAAAFKSAIERGQKGFYLGIHKEKVLTPRPSGPLGRVESHHGIISAWMRAKFVYDEGDAPTIFMYKELHDLCTARHRDFITQIAKGHGQSFKTFDYRLLTETQVKLLSDLMFEDAGVPLSLRTEYYSKWNIYKNTLSPKP